jgi:hypothetical protein
VLHHAAFSLHSNYCIVTAATDCHLTKCRCIAAEFAGAAWCVFPPTLASKKKDGQGDAATRPHPRLRAAAARVRGFEHDFSCSCTARATVSPLRYELRVTHGEGLNTCTNEFHRISTCSHDSMQSQCTSPQMQSSSRRFLYLVDLDIIFSSLSSSSPPPPLLLLLLLLSMVLSCMRCGLLLGPTAVIHEHSPRLHPALVTPHWLSSLASPSSLPLTNYIAACACKVAKWVHAKLQSGCFLLVILWGHATQNCAGSSDFDGLFPHDFHFLCCPLCVCVCALQVAMHTHASPRSFLASCAGASNGTRSCGCVGLLRWRGVLLRSRSHAGWSGCKHEHVCCAGCLDREAACHCWCVALATRPHAHTAV